MRIKVFFTEEKAIKSVGKWENNRLPADTINNQLTGFQILECYGKLSLGFKKSIFIFWTSAVPCSKIFLGVPGHEKENDQTTNLSGYNIYVRDDKDWCFSPEEFSYNSEEYVIRPRLLV